jgi:hypothetical protein
MIGEMEANEMSSLIVAFLWTTALADDPCLATGGRDETVPRVEELRRPIPSGTRSFVPRFQRGFLLWGHPQTPAGPDITIRSTGGDDLLELKVELSDVKEAYPASVSPLPGGRGYVVAAATWNLNNTRSSWLLFYSPKGELLSQKKITPFYVGELTVADDGTVWAFGFHSKALPPDSPEPTLYQFSPGGSVLRRLLPRNAFEGEDLPCNGASPGYGKCEIQAAKGRVVAYAPRAETVIEWMESEEKLNVYQVPRPAGRSGEAVAILGLAVTDSGEILASADRIYRLDRASRRWIPVAEERLPARAWRLFGATGNAVLVNGDSSDPFHFRLVHWAPECKGSVSDPGSIEGPENGQQQRLP